MNEYTTRSALQHESPCKYILRIFCNNFIPPYIGVHLNMYILKVGVEESKKTNNAKNVVRFKQLIRDL
jgi:hypothetical protein